MQDYINFAEQLGKESNSEIFKTKMSEIVEKYKTDTVNNAKAAEWLKENQDILAKEASKFAMKSCNLNELLSDIKTHLWLVHTCLIEGTIEVLKVAKEQGFIPSRFSNEIYQNALNSIKQKALKELQSELSESLSECLNFF